MLLASTSTTILLDNILVMTTTTVWSIKTLERETSDGFVYTAHYNVSANDGTYSAGGYGSVSFERPETLIAYDDLTEEIVIGWVKQAIGGDEKVAEVEAALQAQLDEKHAPSKASGKPWS